MAFYTSSGTYKLVCDVINYTQQLIASFILEKLTLDNFMIKFATVFHD